MPIEDYRATVTVNFELDFGTESRGDIAKRAKEIVMNVFEGYFSRAECLEITINRIRKV